MKYFSSISSEYKSNSLVQNSAADTLIEMAGIRQSESVLDLGCGPGHISSRIYEKTRSRVTAIDASEGMIEQAKENYTDQDIEFRVLPAEQLIDIGQYDLIFCNSTFQWFRQPELVVRKCFNALRTHGRMLVQAPATSNYCPNFIVALDSIRNDSRTRDTFASFSSPWFFAETAEAYSTLFTRTAFLIKVADIRETRSSHTPEAALRIFKSGAAAGYLNRDFYQADWPDNYENDFLSIVSESLKQQAQNDEVELLFKRIFLHADKPR